MKRAFAFVGTLVVGLFVTQDRDIAQQARPATQRPTAPRTAPSTATPQAPTAGLMSLDSQKALIQQYCQGCHNDTTKSGGMTLTALDLAHVDQNVELTEKIIRKLRTGLMPPAIATKRPSR